MIQTDYSSFIRERVSTPAETQTTQPDLISSILIETREILTGTVQLQRVSLLQKIDYHVINP